MTRFNLIGLTVVFALPLVCAAETWKDVPIVDVACSAKVKANPDSHSRDCALKCSKTGYGIIISDGTYLKLDAKGNKNAEAALQSSTKTDHLRVTVNGKRDGDTIKVRSLKM